MIIAFIVTIGLPSHYRSRAVILIEQQEIPQDFVRSLVTSFADQRVHMISQRVLTNSNLTQIIQKYDLYSRDRGRDTLELILERMRKDISILPISAEVVDPRQGRSVPATIAFELAYENRDAQLSQRVANEIVSLFLNENLKQRTQTSTETLNFLSSESERLGGKVANLEAKLATFKQLNQGRLSELASLNMDLLNRTENELTGLDGQLRSLTQQKVYLESELLKQKPNTLLVSETGERILGPADRLKIMESEFIPLASKYGADHPDVISKRKEIESLRSKVGNSNSVSELRLRLESAETALATAEKRYSADHPDIKNINRQISAIRKELLSKVPAAVVGADNTRADNPAYIDLQARLNATDQDLESLQNQRVTLKSKLNDLETRITKAPQVEREYRMLMRDYENEQRKYQEVQAKRQEADLATNLESKQQGERFTLIEPPVIPEEPYSPNRMILGLIGAVMTLAGGVGAGALAENLDSRVYGRDGVMRLLGTPPLSVIPFIENEASRGRKVKLKMYVSLVLVTLVFILLVITHFFVRPLDVIFYQGLRWVSAIV